MKLRTWQRRVVYGAFLLVFASGLALFLVMKYGQVEGDFGPRPHPSQAKLLAAHGGAAMLWLIALGVLIDHLRAGWKAGRSLRSGLLQLVAQGILVATGFALYYLGDEVWLERTRFVHLWVGLVLPVFLIVHILGPRGWGPASWRARQQHPRPTIRAKGRPDPN